MVKNQDNVIPDKNDKVLPHFNDIKAGNQGI